MRTPWWYVSVGLTTPQGCKRVSDHPYRCQHAQCVSEPVFTFFIHFADKSFFTLDSCRTHYQPMMRRAHQVQLDGAAPVEVQVSEVLPF
jgi:hypothetical protein